MKVAIYVSLQNTFSPAMSIRIMRRDLSRCIFTKQRTIRIDKQQKERYNNIVIDNDIII